MSQQLINHSQDLKRLRDEGFDISVQDNYLVIRNVPYVNSSQEIKHGTLVSTLKLSGDITDTPDTHVMYFDGEYPCNKDGSEIKAFKHQSQKQTLGKNIIVHHSFSSKPKEGYRDYYEKVTTYVAIISGQAQAINPGITAKKFTPIMTGDESVFAYLDTASSRANINIVTDKLRIDKIGIVGLGGTGAYVLDLVAKTPVKEIHLYDGDIFSQHNAFRAPGAASVATLREKPKKADFYKKLYSEIHQGIIAHSIFIEAQNVQLLSMMDFIFLCMDNGKVKEIIVRQLEKDSIPFIDVGMGVELVDAKLHGIIRVTTSINKKREHVHEKKRIPFNNNAQNNEYSTNIQIADLNALNAALAVIKWKKLLGFYGDTENELNSTYTIDGNHLLSEDQL